MPRPNILFIMDDQHRHDYLGAAGADFLRTLHLDRLAAAGVRFTQCTTNAPVCAPARIGLASGLQPSRLGCLDNSGRLASGHPHLLSAAARLRLPRRLRRQARPAQIRWLQWPLRRPALRL